MVLWDGRRQGRWNGLNTFTGFRPALRHEHRFCASLSEPQESIVFRVCGPRHRHHCFEWYQCLK
ncbi:hypothetical protein JMJ77_0000956 [Colletotrichum scovillei]|uniref:Uncharacterized protein n=1 Tax=Colletotrichum scovillei TaxID=1209932 RepID=A0A9P7RC91_9PEZI|nr:hypothetical protein JMJ77_0000956 [Colletotrichum scovillei]KAG7072173.1 hypothetical protein JMJ76_0005032 [Colletotrichum scovillei]KAG7080417.1 hypothetical protein JMJ78_0007511 [Colletotrichum scovillei]